MVHMFHRWGLVLLVLALAGPALAQRRRMGKFQEPNHQEEEDFILALLHLEIA